ncbi:Pycsar system effector family protein [Kitasatospora sp. NPDC088351]|uniref:Pycsar system effector family protein n=1 Tax=unclassified Kitasatospora TaxID=2633591 RepID=UPI00343AC41E
MPTAPTPSPAPSPTPPPTAGSAGGTALLAELRTEIARADSKAAILVAALGVLVGVLGGLLAGGDWRPERLAGPAEVLLISGAAGLAASLLSLLLAVLPRYRRSTWCPGRPLAYFGDIRRATRQGLLAEALADTERLATEGVLTALADTSLIVSRKHRWVRTGVFSFGLGMLLLVTALLIG